MIRNAKSFFIALALAGCAPPGAAPKPEPAPQAPAADNAETSVGVALDTATLLPGHGALPTEAEDSVTRFVGGGTVLHTEVSAFPAYQLRPEQVEPGGRTSGGMRVQLRAFARDTLPAREGPDLPLAACPFVLRLHRDPERRLQVAWRSDRAAGDQACPRLWRHTPSDASAQWEVPEMLGDSLDAGTYHFSYAIRLEGRAPLQFSAGSAYLTADRRPPSRDLSVLRMSAHSEVVGQAPRMLRTTVTLRNTGTHPVQFEHGACTPDLRLYRTAERSGQPVWRSELRKPPGAPANSFGYACPAVLHGRVLAPGDTAQFTPMIPLAEVLADSLPAGLYYATAELTLLNDEQPVSRWGTVHRLDAGHVDLPRAPDPLPSARTIGGLRYEAATTVRGDTVRTVVRVTNGGSARALVSVPRDCPVIVYGWATAAQRDSIYPQGRPAWQRRDPCRLEPRRFALDPGQSWEIRHDAALVDMRRYAGPRTLYLAAWVPGEPDVKLAAGELVLR